MIKIRSSESFGFENSQEKKSVLVKGVTPWTKTQIQLMSDVILRLVEKSLLYGTLANSWDGKYDILLGILLSGQKYVLGLRYSYP